MVSEDEHRHIEASEVSWHWSTIIKTTFLDIRRDPGNLPRHYFNGSDKTLNDKPNRMVQSSMTINSIFVLILLSDYRRDPSFL